MAGITGHQLEHETPPLLGDVLRVHQILLARVKFKLNVQIAVLFGLDLADNTRCDSAGIEADIAVALPLTGCEAENELERFATDGRALHLGHASTPPRRRIGFNRRQPMPIERSNRPVAAARLAATAWQLLDASTLCAIATVTADGRAHLNTAYFAWSRDFDIVWMSEPQARHSRNLRANDSTAIAVYDSSQTWGKPDRGIQLFGSAREVGGEDAEPAERHYTKRFPDFTEADLSAYGFYVFRPRRLKLFDERALGAGTFVTARLTRDRRLAWERTEIYRAAI